MLDAAWDFLRQNILEATDIENQGYMLDLTGDKVKLQLIEKGYLCPVDNVIIDAPFCGYSLSGSDGFMAQARFIAGVYGGTIPEYVEQKKGNEGVRAEKQKEASRFEEVVCGPLYCNVLLGYLKGRGIPAEIARAACEEVRFRLYGKRYFAVGFRNMSGGYELRTRFMKWCLPPKDISLIRNGSLTCNLFEGFIDYLSWKVLGISRKEDYLVLNSVALLERSFPYLDHYGKIRCYLDNDDTGKRTLANLRKRYGSRIDDCSDLYAGYKDLNEYLESNFPLEQ